jgi:hypothetical protein
MPPNNYNRKIWDDEWEVDSDAGEDTAEQRLHDPQQTSVTGPSWFCEAWLEGPEIGTSAPTDYAAHTKYVDSERRRTGPMASTIGSMMTITQRWTDLVIRSREAPSGRATTIRSATTFFTAVSNTHSYVTAKTRTSAQRAHAQPKELTEDPWIKTLRDRGLLEPEETEVNWSGKGQHVQFQGVEDVPLITKSILGHSNTAVVEAVRCRRIQLARKSIMCNRRFTKEEALVEVEHLHKLHHAHIVQLVGTYVLNRTFAILLYPATEFNLDTFMEVISDEKGDPDRLRHVLAGFLQCLANALDYIHSQHVKHYDIKPKNLLISRYDPLRLLADKSNRPLTSTSLTAEYRIYFADFGISHSFAAGEDVTDTPISVTRKYCAPESADQAPRGTSADIFSLGCVYLEMLTVCLGSSNDKFVEFRGLAPNMPYYQSIDESKLWSEDLQRRYAGMVGPGKFQLIPCEEIFELVRSMLEEDPEKRPKSEDLVGSLGTPWCCYKPPEPFVADPDLEKGVDKS